MATQSRAGGAAPQGSCLLSRGRSDRASRRGLRPSTEGELMQGRTTERFGSPWLTPDEAAAYARCRKDLVRQLVATGALRAVTRLGERPGPGARVLINKADLDACMYENEVDAGSIARAVNGAA